MLELSCRKMPASVKSTTSGTTSLKTGNHHSSSSGSISVDEVRFYTKGSESVIGEKNFDDTDDTVTAAPLSRHESRYSVKSIYGGLDSGAIELSRKKTRETICDLLDTKAGEPYVDDAVILTEAVDEVGKDGREFSEIDPELVTWDGDDDPKNPRNWPKWEKAKVAFLVSLFTMCAPLTSSILAPAVPDILRDYNNHNATVGSLFVSCMVFTWAVSALVIAPLSEVIGRKIVLLVSILWCAIWNIACAVAPTTATMLLFRIIGGTINCAPIAVGAGTLADLYDDVERTWPLALYGIGPSIGPVIAPIISGFVVEYLNWHWTFWIVAIIVGVVFVVGVFFYRESYPPYLLSRKAAKLRKETGNPNLHTIWELSNESMLVKLRNAVVRPVFFLCTNFVVLGLGLHMAFVYGFMYLMLVSFPTLWQEQYNFSIGITGLAYIPLGIGIIAGTLIFTPLIRNFFVSRMEKGIGRPEDKLVYLPVSTFIMSVGLFWYGWSAQAHVHWIMPMIGVCFFGSGIFVVFQAIQSYLVELNPRLASSILAAVVLGRGLLGGTFPLFGHAMYQRLGYGWGNTVIGILMLILGMPFPIIIYFYGPRIRAWCDKRLPVI